MPRTANVNPHLWVYRYEQQVIPAIAVVASNPQRFNAQLTAALDKQSCGPLLRQLAGYSLNANKLTKLAKGVSSKIDAKADLSPLAPFSLGIVSNKTTELIIPALIATALRHGVALQVRTTPFDQVMQIASGQLEAFEGTSLDAVLLAVDLDGLPVRGHFDSDQDEAATALGYLNAVRTQLAQRYGAPCIVQNCTAPENNLFGSYSRQVRNSKEQIVAAYNVGLAQSIAPSADYLFDVDALSRLVGLGEWYDPVMNHVAKLPFAQKLVPLYADHLCRILGAIKGKSRRALILDLDNTLWGGVIGDDGVEGIRIGAGDPVGEAHLAVQQIASDLRGRGVVLAVCSKNEKATALIPFQKHPDMLLKEGDIAVFIANWSDKASNIRAIAEQLNLGLESFVFLDDNPMERDLVRRHAPEVAVPELPGDAALYARTLIAGGYFETTQFSDEDRLRVESYQANAKRAAILDESTDMESYLRTLQMVSDFRAFDEVGLPRIAQLISKSNQWNLTTHRRSESQVREVMRDPAYYARQVRLEDSFGDNGMVCVLICRKEDSIWEVDTWLMSCRVLGRRLDEFVFAQLAQDAIAQGAKRILGTYIPTAKNIIVAQQFAKLGFAEITAEASDLADGATRWQFDLESFLVPELPIANGANGHAE